MWLAFAYLYTHTVPRQQRFNVYALLLNDSRSAESFVNILARFSLPTQSQPTIYAMTSTRRQPI